MLAEKFFSIALSCSLLFVFSGAAAGQGHSGRLARLKTDLALTGGQVNDIGALLKKHQQTAVPIRQELRARIHEQRNALGAPDPSPSTVGQLVIARQGLNRQLRALNVRLRTDIAALLTPEQKQKLKQRQWRFGRRMPRGLSE
jgi:Spy/CpxP family protein refolding chaperone